MKKLKNLKESRKIERVSLESPEQEPPEEFSEKQTTLSDLTQDPQNTRKHTRRNIGMIEASLRQVGAARSGVIDENGTILAGNGTYEALAAAGINKVKVVEADGEEWVVVRRKGLTAEQKRALAIADNRAAELAEWDGPTLAASGIDLAPWFSEAELKKIGVGSSAVGDDAPEPQLDRAEALREQYGVKLGQVWQLGEHRLMCGNAGIEQKFFHMRADLLLTDPPYGIKRDKGFGGFGGFGGPPIARRVYNDEWDSERPSKETFDHLLSVAEHGIIFGGNFFADILPKGNHWLVWDKLNTMPTFGDCELAWTNIERNSVKKYTVEYNGLIGKEHERFHPTQKPVAIITSIVKDYTENSSLVYDPFLGSGTTLIACEQLNRKCYAMEISPAYVAVSIQRWVDLTGKEPKLI